MSEAGSHVEGGRNGGRAPNGRPVQPEASFARQAVRGSLWTSVPIVVGKVASLTTTFFLGFLLEPGDFGLAWFAISAAGLATGLHVLAASDVLLAMPRSFAKYAGPIQLLSLATACAEVVLVAGLGIVLGSVYPDRHGLTTLMLVVALRPLIDALTVVPMSRLRLDLAYRKISLIDGTTALFGPCGSIAAALAGLGPAAIVVPPLFVTAVRAFLYWRLGRCRIAEWSTRRWRPLLGRFLLATFGSYLNGALALLETAVLGALAPASTAGLFAFAMGIATQANIVISFHIAGSLHPIFSHLRNSRERQVSGLLRSVSLLATVLVPLLLVQAALSGPLVRALWGGKWDDAIPAFMAISIGQAFLVAQWPASLALKAQGRFRGFLKLQAMMIATSAILCSVAASVGGPWMLELAAVVGLPLSGPAATPLAVASAGAAGLAFFGPFTLWLAIRHASGAPREALSALWSPWIAALPAAGSAGWAGHAIEALGMSLPVTLAALGFTGALAWGLGASGTLVLRPSARQDARHVAGAIAARLRPRAVE